MTGGKEKKQTNQMIAADRAQNAAFANQYQGMMGGRSGTSYGKNEQTYGDLYSGYKNLASGLDPMGNTISSSSGAYVPNFNTGKWGDVQNMYREFMGASGGLDPTRIAEMDKQLAGLGTIGQYGASSADMANRLRGGGVYEDFAKTGGYTPEQMQNVRSRAINPARAYQGNLRDELGRQARTTGGGANTAAALARMSRQGAQDIGGLSRDTELGLQDQIRQNKLLGAGGLSSTEQAIVSNQLAGLGGALSGQQGLAESIRSGRQWGTGGLADIAGREAAARQAAASAGASNDKYLMSLKLAGLGGLSGLRGQELGQQNFYDTSALGSQGQLQGGQANTIQARIQNNPYTSPWQIAGGLLGAGAGVLTGLGSWGGGSKPTPNPWGFQ